MKFTLSLHDYLDQYTLNKTQEHVHCPVCYESIMTFDLSSDVKHLFQCYKEELLLRRIVTHKKQHGCLPEIDVEYINKIDEEVTRQLLAYCESYQKLVNDLLD